MKHLSDINQLEIRVYYKMRCGFVGGPFTCFLPNCWVQSIGENTIMARYGDTGDFKEMKKQEVFDYINCKGGYDDKPC